MGEKEKIREYLKYKGISKNKFYAQTGLSVGFLDSGNSLGVDKLRIIVNKYPDLNLEWLIWGQGDMLKKDSPHVDYSGVIADNSRSNTVSEPKYSYEENADRIIKIPLNKAKDLIRDKILELVESGRFYPAQLVRNMIKDKDKEIIELREKVSDLEKKLNAMGHAPISEEIVNEKGR